MSMRKPNDPHWIVALCRLYSAALWLYPRSHRERWGADMRQAFRDRCREAARAGRGPASVLFADLLPDLAASAGRERLDDVMEFHPMKRVLPVVLLFSLLGLIFPARLGVVAQAVGDWWKQHETALDAQALRDHEAALAPMVQQRGGMHADVIAAQLYWDAGNGFRLAYPEGDGSKPAASETAAENALLDRADDAFAKALRADDAWALWLAAVNWDCPARKAVCKAEAGLDRLREVDAGNGAVWLLEMQRAKDAGDALRQRAALARLARASRFDWHFGDNMQGMMAAFALQLLPERLLVTYPRLGVKATPEDSASLQGGAVGSMRGSMAGPGYKVLLDYCRTPDPPTNAERAADCRAAGLLLAEHGTELIDVMIGNRLWLRTAAPDERAQVRQRIRDAHWRLRQMQDIEPATSPEAARRWRAAWMDSTSEMQVTTRLLRENGIPLHAPPGFRVDPKELDPAE